MTRTLKLTITAGDKTCVAADLKRCPYLGATHMGTRPVCLLFRRENCDALPLREFSDGPLKGWLRRADVCMAAEVDGG